VEDNLSYVGTSDLLLGRLLTHDIGQVYVTGSAFVILSAPQAILQTVYDDDTTPLEAIAVDEVSGKIACCTRTVVRIYSPYGLEENLLKVI
jgi:hypothetical protein